MTTQEFTICEPPPNWIGEDLILHPSRLEDSYTTPVVLVELRDLRPLSSPHRHVDTAGDFEKKRDRDRRDRNRARARAEAAAWRRERDDPVGAAIRESKRRVERRRREPFVERRWWRLPCGTVVGVPDPRRRNWPSPGDPDPTGFRQEQRLRDLADAVELGPVVGLKGHEDEAHEIELEIRRLRETADAIRAKRELPR